MNKNQMIHETFVKDVVDVLSNVKNFDQIDWVLNKRQQGSISKQASNLILVFPVIVSNSLSIQTAMLITKAIERKCVALLRILFAAINITEIDNLAEFINQFHNNLNSRLTIDDFANALDKLEESGTIEITNKDVYDTVMENMKNINYYLSSVMNETSLNDYSCKSTIDGIKVNLSKRPINEAIEGNLKDTTTYFNKQILPQDAEKVNELMPTLVQVNFTTVDNNSKTKNTATGVIGVKAKMYPVDSMDIISRVVTKYSDNNTLFNLIRASTREISFFRDFLFAVDKAKLDAINVGKDSKNAKIFKLLERRANKNKFFSLIRRNDASPITSLIMSQEEVEYIKKYHSMNLEKVHVVRSILSSYNLMDIVIADESLEIAKFLYDDDDIFETMTFDSLEKEAKDSSYKKVINLMSKINR